MAPADRNPGGAIMSGSSQASHRERAEALLRDAGIVLPEDEIAALAEGLAALQRLLDIVRAGRPAP
jgi:hypothetical protein